MSPLMRLKPYLRPHLGLILASGALAIPLSGLRVAPAPLVQKLIDELLNKKDASKLLLFPMLFIGLYVVNFVVRFLHYYLLRVVVARVNQRLKNDLYRHIMGLSADHFTQQSTGTLISRVGNDTAYIDSGLASINVIIREPVTFLMLFGYAVSINWKLTLITFLILPPLAWVFSTTGRNLKRYISGMQEENARLFSTLQESFVGIRIIKMFRLEGYVRDKFLERSQNFTKLLLKTAVLEEASHPLVELLTAFAIAAVIYYGGLQVVEGKMTSGELFAFFLAFGMMMHPLRILNDVSLKLNAASAAAKRIFDCLLYTSPSPRD